ncbi:Gfo/Idh/MocA family protein [Paenibacillus agricola]|uniref:Gfo/Idh/MocA family oxidoreductase n=1 Tax=Paenibacillus agricola TaxID=2716264 RepID=A0ABX0JB42_9BACL|nr:Gfo/Idh/MocA family oxidoreductase [Paenibacillus agricola]NHN32763.1 Gfo/Idh/MocA family oxidoreductase [Paenibacillus agricola]
MDKVRFGIVGCGYFGSGLSRILHRMERSEVTAVYGGSRSQLLAEELQCNWMESLEELMESDRVDAVIVTTPSHLHRDPVILAARHGKHVFCEKPVTLKHKDCEDMIEACKKANVLLMAGHIYYFVNGIHQARRWIQDGEIGKPLVVHSERTGWEFKQEKVSWKKNNESSGGHLFHHIHELDFLQTIMGPAKTVSMAGGNLAHNGEGYGNEEDILLLTLQFEGGALGSMQYGSGFRWGEHYIKINGTEGAILIDFKKSKVYLRNNKPPIEHLLHSSVEEDEERAQYYRDADGGIAYGKSTTDQSGFLTRLMELEMKAFRDAVMGIPVEEHLKSLFDGSAARSSVATAEAALTSLREQRWIQLN